MICFLSSYLLTRTRELGELLAERDGLVVLIGLMQFQNFSSISGGLVCASADAVRVCRAHGYVHTRAVIASDALFPM